ncbi:MAG: DUF475 domain-containing protein [Novosphingobium sp.]|nr:DUF475 domain-containing protein [Novosphingobium sp.]
MLHFFKGSAAFTAVCLLLGGWLGWWQSGSFGGTAEVLWIVLVLSLLEISLSFDNAVVNAAVLKDMEPLWRKRFLTWGMVIAVFGMRIVFPLAIVAIAASLGPVEALRLSLEQPERYEALVSGAHLSISGFGGAFLAMVGIRFFFDSDKQIHWIGTIERQLARFGRIDAFGLSLLLVILVVIARGLTPDDGFHYLLAGMLGIACFVAVEAVGHWLEGDLGQEGASGVNTALARAGLGGFIYLNVLDASFSFDGVIGAFALSNNMLVIALGLSIGAMWVRSLTIMLVEKGSLSEYRYLEHGAFWAILALAAIMLISPRVHTSETVTGLIGAVLIAASLFWSVLRNRRERAAS